MKRYLIVMAACLVVIIIGLPAGLVHFFGKDDPLPNRQRPEPAEKTVHPRELERQIAIPVYRAEKRKVETYPLEVYVAGVVAAEMPADFAIEALKAQAMAARTYIVRRILEKDFSDVPPGAYVSDTLKHQVFLDEAQLRERWGSEYERKIGRIHRAVVETNGKILTYDGKPINATFFSTSNGYTENSEEYWGRKVPYLRSTKSPWDERSPRFAGQMMIPLSEFQRKLGVDIAVPASGGQPWYRVLAYTTGKRVAKIRIGEKVFTGREVRERLGLASAYFTFAVKNDHVIVTTKGYGHGVGMSQWGANGQAQEGKTAEEIVKYYYRGIAIEDYRKFVQDVQ
ncbi:stage II sporulation protein D [Bacillaceae bacterium]